MTHTHRQYQCSLSADSTETLVMFAGLMMAFIYHGNAHEAVTGALQTWEVSLTCIHVVHHWTAMSWHNGNEWVCHNGMIHVALKWWMCVRQFRLHHLTIKERNTDSTGDLSNTFPSFNGKSRPSSGFRAGQEKTDVQVNHFLHSYTRPSRAHLILKRCTLHACLSSNCQSRCQEGWWTILSAIDDRWRGVRGACWVHVKGSASKGLL